MRLLFCLLLTLCLAPEVFAWHTNTHLQMTRDAISLMPEDFRNSVFEQKKFLESGIMDPDHYIGDL